MNSPSLSIFLTRVTTCLSIASDTDDPVTFSQFKTALGDVTNANLSRILNAMQEASLLVREETARGYRLTENARMLGRSLVGHDPLEQSMRRLVQEVAVELRESAAVFDCGPDWIRVQYKAECPGSQYYMREGDKRLQLGGHAAAQVFAAFNAGFYAAASEQLREDLELSPEQWEARLAEIRKKGFWLGMGEETPFGKETGRLTQLTRLALPLKSSTGAPLNHCLCVTSYRPGFTADQIQMVLSATQGIVI